MKRKTFFILVFIFSLIFNFQFSIFNIYAQPVCDLCGKCEGMEEPTDYADCVNCLYDADGQVINEVSSTVIGCVPTTPSGFTQTVVRLVSSLAGGITFIVFIYGAFKVLTSSGDMEKLSSGKGLMAASIIAAVLIIFSVFIFRFIATQILKIPGFGE